MRATLLWTVFFVTCGFGVLRQTGDLPKLAHKIHSVFYDNEYRVDGPLRRVTEEEVLELLPRPRSYPWWWLHHSDGEELVRHHPWIKNVSVEPCSSYSWGCLRVHVTEREAALRAVVSSEPWLVDGDGALMFPVPTSKDGKENFNEYPLVRGVVTPGMSPEIMEARLSYVVKARTRIEEVAQLKTSEIEMKPSGEMAVSFTGRSFKATFSADDGTLARIGEESVRLKRVLAEFTGREDRLATVDLAFDRVASVRFHGAAVADSPRTAGP